MTTTRYGVFLRPDPATCWAVSQLTLALRQQYGMVAGAVFPPHATLIGNYHPDVPEDAVIALLDEVFAGTSVFPVYNHGIDGARFDLDRDADGRRQNGDLARVAGAVRDALAPSHRDHEDHLAPNIADYRFQAHLSLGSFDLQLREDLVEEASAFLRGVPATAPQSFPARWYSLFRFEAEWSGPWWEQMTWQHVTSWEARA
jgi:hypothetical protein